jgi:hypothetical protein
MAAGPNSANSERTITMTNVNLRYADDEPDRVCVTIDNRFEVALIRTGDTLCIEVFPITGGQVWDDPSDRFEVDESEVTALEQELRHD